MVIFEEIRTGLSQWTKVGDREARNVFSSIEGNYIYRHHVEPEVQLYVLKEESFPTPPRYIDVVRRTHTSLDVFQESRIDDYWNIDADRKLSESWTTFTQFTKVNEKPPDGYTWSWERLTKIQATTRPDHLETENWSGMSEVAQRMEKQQWAIEKPKLDSARKLRGICFADPDENEFKETIKNARKKLEF